VILSHLVTLPSPARVVHASHRSQAPLPKLLSFDSPNKEVAGKKLLSPEDV
jgi:hypothetical protein